MEYEALGENFHDRGQRSEEQIALLRALWTQDTIDFNGRWHKVTAAGLNPLPVQRPIPIWIGGGAEAVVRRVARIADGWFPRFGPSEESKRVLERLRSYALESGRDPASIGIEGRVNVFDGGAELWATQAADWKDLGATHISVNTMRAGLASPDDHISTIRRFKEVTSDL